MWIVCENGDLVNLDRFDSLVVRETVIHAVRVDEGQGKTCAPAIARSADGDAARKMLERIVAQLDAGASVCDVRKPGF